MDLRLPILVVVVAVALPLRDAAGAGPRGCARGYSYAGFQSPSVAYGVAARIAVLSAPSIEHGQVAAWIGIGGPGLGPRGADQWLQVGIAGFPDGTSELYYEFVSRGDPVPHYMSLASAHAGEGYRVAIVERPEQPNAWRVLLDGRPASPVIVLPGSHGSRRPIATAESWDGGVPGCNRFSYRFTGLATATRLGGRWRPFVLSEPIESRGYRVAPGARGFTAASV
jgi:hypothetical protein